jgi:carbon storage regulator
MLVLSRKEKESILIGDGIEIIVQEIGKDNVRIAIIAPNDVKILRKELLENVKDENRSAQIQADPVALKALLRQRKTNESK